MLPRHQISESQRGTAESLIEPDAAIMQGYFGGQADLKAVEGVGAFAIETEDMLEQGFLIKKRRKFNNS